MKNTLSILLLSAITSLSVAPQICAAQDNNDKKNEVSFRFLLGVKGGLNMSNITINNDGDVNDKKAIASYNVGIYGDLGLLSFLSIQPGVFLTGKGSKFVLGDEGSSNYTRVTARPVYVEVPVNVVVKIPLFNKVKLFAGAGPYLAVGVGGKSTTDGKFAGISYSDSKTIEYGSDDLNGSNGNSYEGNFKRFDAGLNFLAGMEISHFTLNVNYGYGLMNIKPGSTNGQDNDYQNRVGSIQVGFFF